MMAGFGEELKSEREQRGISLETLSERTKVIARHFRALEEGDYATLPGGVFRRGIVRAYLGTVGLDEAVWMPRFDLSHADFRLSRGDSDDREDAWAAFAANVKRGRGTATQSDTARWLGVLLLLVLLLAAGWAVWHFELRGLLGADAHAHLQTVPGQSPGTEDQI